MSVARRLPPPSGNGGIPRVAFLRYRVGDEAVDLAWAPRGTGPSPRSSDPASAACRTRGSPGTRGSRSRRSRSPTRSLPRELLDRNGEVLHQPGKVAEPQVNDLDAALLCECQDVLRCFRHIRLLISDRDGRPAARRAGTRSCDRLVVGVDGLREDLAAGEVGVYAGGGGAAFGDSPHDERGPRPASPATNTPSALLMKLSSRAIAPRSVIVMSRSASRRLGSAPANPSATSASCAGNCSTDSGCGWNVRASSRNPFTT